jgi:DHA2 family multidrug resistance protein
MFGAALVPLSQSTMLNIYPPEKRGSAMAIWGMGVMVGPILGPTLGGYLTDAYNWRWVFYINVPFGILAFVGMMTFLSETKRKMTGRFDWFGFGMLSLGVGALQMMLDRGELLDWFGSAEIVTEAILSGLGFYLFLAHTATAQKSFVSPDLFKDRNFSTGLVAIFSLGIILYGSLALLSPFLQTLMNYPVVTAGLVMAPRGAGTMLGMFMVGRLIGKVDIRLMLTVGFSLTAWSLWEMTGFNTDVAQWTIVWTGIVQGLGLGLLFVPLTTITFATLAPERRNEATGLFSLMRNIGGSIGIATTGTMLARNSQATTSLLGSHVTAYDATSQAMFAQTRTAFMASGADPVTATTRAYAALFGMVQRQAAMVSFVGLFQLLGVLFIAVVPLVLLMKRPRRRGEAGAGAH